MRSFAVLVTARLVASAAASAASFDSPKRKSGLWEIRISSDQAKGVPMVQQCVDEKSDDLMGEDMAGGEELSCSKNEMRREGDTIVGESVCKVNGSTARTRAVITGRFDSAYKVNMTVTYEPPLMGMREASMVMEGTWLGPCKPGQQPGDVSIPGMPNINMDDIKKGAPK